MKALYPAWVDYKAEETTSANATKLQWVWDTYYKNSEIVKMDIADIDVVIMKGWFLKTIREYQLTGKKYKEMKSLANMLLDYAIEKRLIGVNVSRNVHGMSTVSLIENLRSLVRKMRPNRYMLMMSGNGCSCRRKSSIKRQEMSLIWRYA